VDILVITQRFFPAIGGAENLAKIFLDHLSINHKITVYTTNAKEIQSFWYEDSEKIKEFEPYEYSIQRCGFLIPTQIKHDKITTDFPFMTNYPGPFSPKMWNDLVLNKIDYDLIYVTSFPHDHIIPAYIAAKKWGIPIIFTPLIHQEFPELYLTSIKLTMLNNSDSIFVISESEKNILIKNGIDKNKIFIIHPFLSNKTNDSKDNLREKFSLINKKIILFIGSKSFVKGIIHVIESLKLIWKKDDESVLVVLGPSTEEYDKYYSELPHEIRERIIDLGIVDENTKRNALAECDFLVLPSKSESFGLVYIEAWLNCKSVIGCNIPPVSELIEQKKDGLLVEFGNIEQLKDSILYLINNPDIAKKFGVEGKKKADTLNSKNNLKMFEEKCISVVKTFKNKKFESI